jgi:hypothetical protein
MRIAFGLLAPLALLFAWAAATQSLLAAGICLAGWLTLPILATRVADSAAQLLPGIVTVRSLPLFLDALVTPSDSTRRDAANAIANSLPHFGNEDLRSLTTRIHAYSLALNVSRDGRYGLDLPLALIAAAQRLHDSRMLLPLAEQATTPVAAPEVRASAKRAIRAIQEACRRSEALGHLLRPAQPVEPAGSLLRPAVIGSHSNSERLLRTQGENGIDDQSA